MRFPLWGVRVGCWWYVETNILRLYETFPLLAACVVGGGHTIGLSKRKRVLCGGGFASACWVALLGLFGGGGVGLLFVNWIVDVI